ncbi:MAG: hypothetical protein ACOX3G_06020 [Armatimonadota bacterium]
MAIGINNSGTVVCSWLRNGASDSRGVAVWTKNAGVSEITVRGAIDYSGGINNYNQIAASGSNASGTSYNGLVRNADSTTRQLGRVSGAIDLFTAGINDSGQVVGSMEVVDDSTGSYTRFATVWDSAGNPSIISSATEGRSWASAISNSGNVAWNWMNEQQNGENWQQVSEAYIWNGQSSTKLSALSSTNLCSVSAMNDHGYAVGQSGNHAVMWKPDGSVVDLGIGIAYDINNFGQIVGEIDGHGGVVWNSTGSITYLAGYSNGYLSRPIAINDNGQIAGDLLLVDGAPMAAMWNPVPEPSAFAVLACGLVGILTRTRKRRNS